MKLSKYKFLLLLLFLVSFFLFIFFDSKQSILIEKDSSFDQINTQFQSNFGITFLKQGVFETNGNELILSEEMSVGSIQKKLERHFGCSFIATVEISICHFHPPELPRMGNAAGFHHHLIRLANHFIHLPVRQFLS